MKLITRETDYALRAICCIAERKGRVVSAAELAQEMKMPRPFLRRLLQALNSHGILKSTRGQGGGFVLAKPAKNIALLDLMKIFQGPLELSECTFKKKSCPRKSFCPLRKKIKRLEDLMIREFTPVTVASLF